MMDLDELEDVEYGCTWLPSVCEALGEQRPEMTWCTCYVDGDQMKSIDIDSLVHNDGLHLFGTWCRMIFALRADECISSSTRAMWFGDSVDTMLKREEIDRYLRRLPNHREHPSDMAGLLSRVNSPGWNVPGEGTAQTCHSGWGGHR